MDRRTVLRGTTAVAAGLAGCLDGLVGGRGGDPGGDAAAGWALPDHPALAAVADQPTDGPPPGEAPGLIVGFEDPSCPSCRRFEREVYPELDSRLLDPGRATFVYRGIPVIAPWGEPASYALEATFARDGPAFWRLKAYYFDDQRSFDADTVLDRTEAYLASETDLDAAAVVRDARQRSHEPAVQADLEAARGSGVRGTPTFVLFSDGAHETSIAGPQSVAVFRRVLGV